eukprot:m.235944 g.235944  ORF g.235944 m.235944 type:complete len:692 (+) comp15262_c0_seq18:5039-7114(+)
MSRIDTPTPTVSGLVCQIVVEEADTLSHEDGTRGLSVAVAPTISLQHVRKQAADKLGVAPLHVNIGSNGSSFLMFDTDEHGKLQTLAYCGVPTTNALHIQAFVFHHTAFPCSVARPHMAKGIQRHRFLSSASNYLKVYHIDSDPRCSEWVAKTFGIANTKQLFWERCDDTCVVHLPYQRNKGLLKDANIRYLIGGTTEVAADEDLQDVRAIIRPHIEPNFAPHDTKDSINDVWCHPIWYSLEWYTDYLEELCPLLNLKYTFDLCRDWVLSTCKPDKDDEDEVLRLMVLRFAVTQPTLLDTLIRSVMDTLTIHDDTSHSATATLPQTYFDQSKDRYGQPGAIDALSRSEAQQEQAAPARLESEHVFAQRLLAAGISRVPTFHEVGGCADKVLFDIQQAIIHASCPLQVSTTFYAFFSSDSIQRIRDAVEHGQCACIPHLVTMTRHPVHLPSSAANGMHLKITVPDNLMQYVADITCVLDAVDGRPQEAFVLPLFSTFSVDLASHTAEFKGPLNVFFREYFDARTTTPTRDQFAEFVGSRLINVSNDEMVRSNILQMPWLDWDQPAFRNCVSLYSAARAGMSQTLDILLKLHASPHAQQQTLSTPLHAASFFTNAECVRQLHSWCGWLYTMCNKYSFLPIEEATLREGREQPKITGILGKKPQAEYPNRYDQAYSLTSVHPSPATSTEQLAKE